jgi:hypothetical protein
VSSHTLTISQPGMATVVSLGVPGRYSGDHSAYDHLSTSRFRTERRTQIGLQLDMSIYFCRSTPFAVIATPFLQFIAVSVLLLSYPELTQSRSMFICSCDFQRPGELPVRINVQVSQHLSLQCRISIAIVYKPIRTLHDLAFFYPLFTICISLP